MTSADKLERIESGRHDQQVKETMTCSPSAPVLFFSQASTMLQSGVPILRALEVLAEQTQDGRFAEITWDLAESLHCGRDFSRALGDFPRVFPKPVVALVAAGERSGALDRTMELSAKWLNRRRDLKSKVVSAMTYPVLVLLFSVVGGSAVCIFLLPELLNAVTSMGVELHWTTKALLEVSHLGSNPAVWLVFFALTGLSCLRLSQYAETERGRLNLARIVRTLPVIGPLFKAMGVSQFAQTLGSTLRVGLDMIKSLKLSAQSSGDAVLELHTLQVIENIKQGDKLADSLEQHPATFPSILTGLVMVGEESGQLASVLPVVTQIYEDEAVTLIEVLMAALEPLLLGGLAVVVAVCALGLLMPLQGLLASL
jgi:type IV pilus assembly protein PilC